MAKTFDQTLAESGQQSTLDQLRKSGQYDSALAEFNKSGSLPSFGSSRQATEFANAGQADPVVQSREDIRASIEAELDLPDRPEVPSLLETFKTQKTEAGLDTLQEEINTLKAAERELVAETRQRKQGEIDKPVAMGVIGGRVTEVERQQSERIDVVQRQLANKTDQYNSALNGIQMIMSFTQQDYDNATASFNSQFTQNLATINAITGIQNDQKDEVQRAKDNANATLSVMMNAVTSGNINYSDLSSDQKLNISKLEARAGLPVGFMSNLKMSPSDKLLNVNPDTGEALMIDENGNFIVKKTGMTIAPKAGKELSGTSLLQAAQSEIISQARSSNKINNYGHIHPDDWNRMKQAWLSEGFNGSEFDSRFASFVDPNRTDSAYNLQERKEESLF